MDARRASEGQLAHFCPAFKDKALPELWNPRGLFTTIVSEAGTDLYKEMVPTVSYQGPASPVEVRPCSTQLAHISCIHTCGLAGSRLIMGKWQPRGFQTRGRQETQGSGGWWGSPLPTQPSVSGAGSQALSDDSVKPHTPAHPFKVQVTPTHASPDYKWNPRKWMSTLFPKTHTISSSHRQGFSGIVSHLKDGLSYFP